MKVAWIKLTVIGYLALILVACTRVANPNAPTDMTSSPSDRTPTALVPPQQGDSTAMPPDLQTPPTSGLENLVEKAKEHLAQRLSISVNDINLKEATPVTWPDSSLGCPQEGMAYAQVLTPGYLILLEHGGNTFEYHASTGNSVATCENPSPPVPGDPGNT